MDRNLHVQPGTLWLRSGVDEISLDPDIPGLFKIIAAIGTKSGQCLRTHYARDTGELLRHHCGDALQIGDPDNRYKVPCAGNGVDFGYAIDACQRRGAIGDHPGVSLH